MRDEQGRLNLLWKSDGNAFGRPTFIFGQRMAENGMRLLGRPKRLLRDTARWEGKVIEAPAVVRRPDAFYMLYSGALCCTKRCRYAVGAARATTLLGRWRKFSGNPILSSGNGWRCPGHTGLATDASGAVTALFHAYRSGLGRLAGRQVLAAPLTFRPDGWPQIGEGRVPPAPAPGAAPNEFADDFVGPRLSPEWEWPLERVPGIRVAGGLELRAPVRLRDGSRAAPRFDNGLLAHRISGPRYVAGTVVDTFLARRRGGRGPVRVRAVAVRRGLRGARHLGAAQRGDRLAARPRPCPRRWRARARRRPGRCTCD